MKYLLFDETEFNLEGKTFCGICFCIFDNLEHIDIIGKHLRSKAILNTTQYANQEYVHYTEDSPTSRTTFIEQIMIKVSFKAYISIRQGTKNDIYKHNNTIQLFENAILKIKKSGNSAFHLIFEEGKESDYDLFKDISAKKSIISKIEIRKKEDLYSSFADYCLGIVNSYLKFIQESTPQRSTNIPFRERDLDTIQDKISILYLNYQGNLISYCASQHNYDGWKTNLKNLLLKKQQ